MKEKPTTFWVSKYALTQGVFVIQGTVYETDGRRYASSPDGLFLLLGADAHETEQGAIADAKKRAERKLANLAKEETRVRKRLAEWS